MNASDVQEAIDSTGYGDVPVLDFRIEYFGDEVNMVLYNDDQSSWAMRFLTCYKVEYETDANWRTISYVKDMTKPQLGHFAQDIRVESCAEHPGFMTIRLSTSLLSVKLICKEVLVEKRKNEEFSFFWQADAD